MNPKLRNNKIVIRHKEIVERKVFRFPSLPKTKNKTKDYLVLRFMEMFRNREWRILRKENS